MVWNQPSSRPLGSQTVAEETVGISQPAQTTRMEAPISGSWVASCPSICASPLLRCLLPGALQEVADNTVLGEYDEFIACYDRSWWRDGGCNGYFRSYTRASNVARDTSADEKHNCQLTCFVMARLVVNGATSLLTSVERRLCNRLRSDAVWVLSTKCSGRLRYLIRSGCTNSTGGVPWLQFMLSDITQSLWTSTASIWATYILLVPNMPPGGKVK